jgi:hypothetical protein
MQQGPFDLSNIKCYAPVGCCPLDPCKVTQEEFICAVRTLLPEGPMFNTALSGVAPPPDPVTGVGCFTVGCTPVCDTDLPGDDTNCNDNPVAFHMIMVDAYAAAAYRTLEAQCCALRELDPCTAEVTVDRWLERYGVPQGECDPVWTAPTKKLILCLLSKLSNGFILNKLGLESLAAYFGVKTWIYNAGDFNCDHVPGIWTLGRRRCLPSGSSWPITDCSLPVAPRGTPQVKWGGACSTGPAIDIVVCQAETWVPDNCLVPGTGATVTPTEELYSAFQWLLSRLLSANTNICVYRCEDVPCLEIE